MKLFFKCYGIFSNLPYKIIMLVVFPILAIGMEILGKLANAPMFALHLSFLTGACIFADNWVLNGICNKKSLSMDFVNSSKRGFLIMKLAIVSEMTVRFLLCVGVFLVTGFIGGYPLAGFIFGLICFSIGTIGITICRHLESLQIVMMITALSASGAAALSAAIIVWQRDLLLPGIQGFGELLPLIISVAAAIVIAAGSSIYTIKRVEETYHD